MREQLEVGARHSWVTGCALLARRRRENFSPGYPAGRSACDRLSGSRESESRSFFTFPVSNSNLSRTMKTNVYKMRFKAESDNGSGVESDMERSGLSRRCKRLGSDHSEGRSQLRSLGLFHFQRIFRKFDSKCKNLKQFVDSPSDESKHRSWFVQLDDDSLEHHDSIDRQNAVSGSETKFFLDSNGQRNYHDRKFSGDNSVGAESAIAVSAFFHLHGRARATTGLSPFRVEITGSGSVIPRVFYFVRLEEAESRRRRQSTLLANRLTQGLGDA